MIFLLERVLPTLTSWPLFIFPVFVIFFMLTSKSDAHDLLHIAAAALIFDFFSGYRFGFMTFAILAVTLAIVLFKTRFNVNPRFLFFLEIYAIIFIFTYFIILSIRSESSILLSQVLIIILETIVIFATLFLIRSNGRNSVGTSL